MNYFFNMSLLLLCVFGSINPSGDKTIIRDQIRFLKRQESEPVLSIKDQLSENYLNQQKQLKLQESYKQYFQQQEKIYQELETLKISSARPLSIDAVLAESILVNSPQEVNKAISGIQQNVFFENEKDMILHGRSGTGKSAIAQAIAIKCQIPCLLFNAGDMSIESLNKIFEYVKVLEKTSVKPCIIIFDGLEALNKKDSGTNNHDNNNLVNFWRKLDKFNGSKVVVIGTINSAEHLPIQIINRTSMIEVPLPNIKQGEAILSYYLKEIQENHNLGYSDSVKVTAAWLARLTQGFSHKELQSVVMKATKSVIEESAISSRSNKFVMDDYFVQVIDPIKKNPQRKLEREIGTWKHYFKMKFRDPRAIPVVFGMGALIATCCSCVNQRKGLAMQEKGQMYQKRGLDMQETAMSADHMAKQAAMNSSVLGIPIGMPLYYGKKGVDSIISNPEEAKTRAERIAKEVGMDFLINLIPIDPSIKYVYSIYSKFC